MSAAVHAAPPAFAERGMLALRITLAMAAAGLLLLAALWQAAFPGERALSGVVLDDQGRPVAGASVRASVPVEDEPEWAQGTSTGAPGGVRTDKDGRFTLRHLTARRYLLQAGRWRLPLPALLTPGTCRVAHRAEGPGRFRFTLTMSHPVWGLTFHQDGVFAGPEEESC